MGAVKSTHKNARLQHMKSKLVARLQQRGWRVSGFLYDADQSKPPYFYVAAWKRTKNPILHIMDREYANDWYVR